MDKLKKIISLLLKAIVAFFIVSFLSVLLLRFIPAFITPYQAYNFVMGDGLEKDWVGYDHISPHFYRAVIASEDSRFYKHFGVDWEAVEEARKHNERYPKKRRRGASTITMQTAKNTFLWHGRTYIRKAMEVYFSYLMEVLWSKQRILTVYSNVVEFGEGLYGVEAASHKYFNKPASKLTKRQAALLAAVLPNPLRWNPAKPTNYINRRANIIMARMNSVRLQD